MIIENRKVLSKARYRRLFLTIFCGGLIAFIMIADFFRNPFMGMPNYSLASLIGLIYILINAYLLGLKLNYIYFSDEGHKIILRHFSVKMVTGDKESIEISKSDFVKYEIKKAFLGLRTDLILHQRLKGQVAKYPPISITSLSSSHRHNLCKILDGYTRK